MIASTRKTSRAKKRGTISESTGDYAKPKIVFLLSRDSLDRRKRRDLIY
jgi:hypothetical protein